jgi:PAS domain S-box-containing protein
MGRGKVIERDGLGQAIRMAGTFMDITDRKEAQERLRESEERFRLSFENANVGECLVDLGGRIIEANHALSEILGYSRQELEKMTVNDIVYPDDASVSPTFMTRATSGEVAKASFEKRYFHKNGNIVWGKVSSSLVRDAKGNPMYFVSHVQDITGLRRAEQEKEALYEQLLQAQKMEALGTLVGGIAHDFNNMLQIIMGYSQILLMDRDQNDKDYKDLKNILFTAQQQADLVSRLLQFARKAPVDPRPLDLNLRITELATVMFKTFPKMINTRLDLAADLKNVMADRIQMDQVIMNLAINARDAMPNGGLLKIVTKNVILGAGDYRAIQGMTPGPYIGVFISDTGGGIGEDDIKRIFEPFFSTKQRGSDRGTGLGLSVVKGIVEQHGGYITCDSAPGRGTEFTVFLPSIEVPSFAD